jgi:hypothetical protein
MSEPLEKLLREAREHFGMQETTRVDWRAVDSALFARVEQERRASRSRAPAPWWPRTLAATLTLSVAALAVVALRGRRAPTPMAQAPTSAVESPADGVSIEGGQALVGGVVSSGERRLQLGDVVETEGTSVRLERPGKVSMTLEANSRIRVTKMQETLVVLLERGAVEAHVTPVAHGEAFAVDVESSRVAVHGTHLRVQRDDWRVVVDVNEGVIAVGDAPRAGPVLGAVVVASAHAEFMAFDALGTLKVSRDPSALRWPPPSSANVVPAATGTVTSGEVHSGVEPASPRVPPTPSTEPRGEVRSGPPATSASTPAAAPDVDIIDVVRRCMAERPRAENVTILVRTTLRLTLGDDGWVQSARFDPPVAPDVNACAAQSIYRTHFDHGGSVSLAVDFKN